MRYRVRHTTTFEYSGPIRESVMEVRMQPRTDERQRCLEFALRLAPEAKLFHYVDTLGNIIHHFDIPAVHQRMELTAEALVDANGSSVAPKAEPASWEALDRLRGDADHWDWLEFSHFAQPARRLGHFMESARLRRRDDPLTVLSDLNAAIADRLKYQPGATRVDSPIDDCLAAGKGVCQDFAHLFIAVARSLGIPARYVSGYLFHRPGSSGRRAEDASHAWAEAFLPGAGWLGFDPSNRSTAGPGHLRVAVGRDYQDVPPTRGVFKGLADTQLTVSVDVVEA